MNKLPTFARTFSAFFFAITILVGCDQAGPLEATTESSLDNIPSSSNSGSDFDVKFESVLGINVQAREVTLPLYKGSFNGQDTYYIITESSDRDNAEDDLGVNWAPKLANALGTAAVQSVTLSNGTFQFEGTVDFSPERIVVPGDTGFPPAQASPGSIGDSNYSPLVTTGNGIVVNAPQVANASGVHDSVRDIDYANLRVTLELVDGFYEGKEILYISTEASDSGTAALEASTFAPNMNAAPGLGSSSERTSARLALVPFVNGETGVDNPNRQGLMSALMGEGAPLNIVIDVPGDRIYSPLWDVHPAVWTDAAIANGERELIDDHDDIADGVEDGFIVSGGNGPANSDLGGLRAAGFIVNCPVIAGE